MRAEVSTDDGNNTGTASIRGIVAQINILGACTSTGSVYGMMSAIYTTGAYDGTGGSTACLWLGWGLYTGSTVDGGRAAWIYCYQWSTGEGPDSIICLYTGAPGTSETLYLIDVEGAALDSNRNMFDNTVINTTTNQSDGRMKIRIGATTYYIPIYA